MRHSIIATVRAIVGRRRRITRDEMAAILAAWEPDGLVAASTIGGRMTDGTLYLPGRPVQIPTTTRAETEAIARAWAETCREIVCVSVYDRDTGGTGSPAVVRYDEPGSMAPGQYAHVAFVPQSAGAETVAYMGRHAARVLVVASA